MHQALRDRLGDHVTQKGSLVEPARLRFDFGHPKALSADDIAAIEDSVNARILGNDAVSTRLMTPDEAIAAGALALFGEKYGEEVRVVSMGGATESAAHYSTELCGGTHVARTGDIGHFRITAEGAVASGVRRWRVTADGALAYARRREGLLTDVAERLKSAPEHLLERVAALVEERRRLDRELAETRKKLASGGAATPVPRHRRRRLRRPGAGRVPARDLRGMADGLKQQVGSGVVAIASADQGRPRWLWGHRDLTDRLARLNSCAWAPPFWGRRRRRAAPTCSGRRPRWGRHGGGDCRHRAGAGRQ